MQLNDFVGVCLLDGGGLNLFLDAFELALERFLSLAFVFDVATRGGFHSVHFTVKQLDVFHHVRADNAESVLAGERLDEIVDGGMFHLPFAQFIFERGEMVEFSGQFSERCFLEFELPQNLFPFFGQRAVFLELLELFVDRNKFVFFKILNERFFFQRVAPESGQLVGVAHEAAAFDLHLFKLIAAPFDPDVEHFHLFRFSANVFEHRNSRLHPVALPEYVDQPAVRLVDDAVETFHVALAGFVNGEHFLLVVEPPPDFLQFSFRIYPFRGNSFRGFFHEADAEHVVQHEASVVRVVKYDVHFWAINIE